MRRNFTWPNSAHLRWTACRHAQEAMRRREIAVIAVQERGYAARRWSAKSRVPDLKWHGLKKTHIQYVDGSLAHRWSRCSLGNLQRSAWRDLGSRPQSPVCRRHLLRKMRATATRKSGALRKAEAHALLAPLALPTSKRAGDRNARRGRPCKMAKIAFEFGGTCPGRRIRLEWSKSRPPHFLELGRWATQAHKEGRTSRGTPLFEGKRSQAAGLDRRPPRDTSRCDPRF